MLLVTVAAQFTAKTTNSEKAIYFLSLITCSTNKLKSHMKYVKTLCFPILRGEKYFCFRKWWRSGVPPPLCSLYCHGLLFLLLSFDTETAKYFHTFDVGLACIYFVALQSIPLKLSLLWCFHI